MKFPTIARIARERSSFAFAVALLVIAFATGCASPGPPHPPSLRLPKVVTDLTAQRIGNEVQLHWTTPTKTTDDLSIKGKITAEICREVLQRPLHQSPSRQPACTPVKRFIPQPGPSDLTDDLPPALTTEPTSLLAYRIQIFNPSGRSAGLSPRAFTLTGPAPPTVEQFRAIPTQPGVQLEWQPQATTALVELDRTLLQAAAGPKQSTKQPLRLTQSVATEVFLRATARAGGTIDTFAQRGATYRYTAQRINTVRLDGHTLEVRSAPSAAITVYMRDTFPPATPLGLSAIPGGTASPHSSIDLSWEPVADRDIAGYIVYRQEVALNGSLTGQPKRLTTAPVVGPAFSDRTAIPGQRYAYRVAAIDTSGNASPPSAPTQESLANP